jgi:hypothetical protein
VKKKRVAEGETAADSGATLLITLACKPSSFRKHNTKILVENVDL